MTNPKTAAEWLEEVASYDHRTDAEDRLVAMLRDAKAELEEWGIGGQTECEECDVRGYGDDGKPCAPCNGTGHRPSGWDAIEAKFARGEYADND